MTNSWIFYALLSAFTAALVSIFAKIGLKSIDSDIATFIRIIIMFAFMAVFIIMQNKLPELKSVFSNTKLISWIFLSAIMGALSWLFYFYALKSGDVSKVAPIDKLSVVITLIFAFTFLGEKFTAIKGLGTTLLIIGSLLLII
jgi:transporter family protein